MSTPDPNVYEALVLIADGKADKHGLGISGPITWPEGRRVPVTLDFEEHIGWATLRQDGDRVYASIETPGSLVGLTPAVGGMGNPGAEMHIETIAVGSWANADDRIGPIRGFSIGSKS